MGHVYTQVTISNPDDPTLHVSAQALVDTGATFSIIPRKMATDLKLPKTGVRKVLTANGEIALDRSRAMIQIDGQSEISPVLVTETLDRVIVGVITLEALSLTVDPTTGRLNEAETLLL